MYYGRKAEPRGNRYLWDAEKKFQHEQHVKRLKNIKPSVDVAAPKGFGDFRRNLKREQVMEDRYAQIEHENRLLLSKMSDIMQKGSLDNVSAAWQYGHSLNRTNRRKELQRITEENQHILRRIQGVSPYYNHWDWEEEALSSEKLVQSISEFKKSHLRGGSSTDRLGRSGGARSPSPGRSPSGAGAGGGSGLEMGSFGGSAYSGGPVPNSMGGMPGMGGVSSGMPGMTPGMGMAMAGLQMAGSGASRGGYGGVPMEGYGGASYPVGYGQVPPGGVGIPMTAASYTGAGYAPTSYTPGGYGMPPSGGMQMQPGTAPSPFLGQSSLSGSTPGVAGYGNFGSNFGGAPQIPGQMPMPGR